MRACAALALLAAVGVAAVTLHQAEPVLPESDIRVPLKSLFIECSLQDVVIISAPVVRDAQYYLTRPDGHTRVLNITRPVYKPVVTKPVHLINTQYDSISIKHESIFKTIVGVAGYKVFDLLPDTYGDVEVFEEQTKDVNNNDFMIGPLLPEDHGNWELSLFYRDAKGNMVEMYQVITLSILVTVPSEPRLPMLKPGDTFEFSFAYAIPGLESCELRAPKSTFDRFYERDMKVDMARCGYKVKNITKEDSGYWSITGVGKIAYGTQVHLYVNDPNEKKKKKKKSSTTAEKPKKRTTFEKSTKTNSNIKKSNQLG